MKEIPDFGEGARKLDYTEFEVVGDSIKRLAANAAKLNPVHLLRRASTAMRNGVRELTSEFKEAFDIVDDVGGGNRAISESIEHPKPQE